MKQLLVKLSFVPFIAFFTMMITVALMGSFLDINELTKILGGTSALPVYYIWLAIITPITVLHHFLKSHK